MIEIKRQFPRLVPGLLYTEETDHHQVPAALLAVPPAQTPVKVPPGWARLAVLSSSRGGADGGLWQLAGRDLLLLSGTK